MLASEFTDHRKGTFAALWLDASSAIKLADWCRANDVFCCDPEYFHCTVCYSSIAIPHAEAIAGNISANATILGWKNLGDHATVLLMDCPIAKPIHDLLIRHGADTSYPEYICHLTIDPEHRTRILPSKIPPFPLHFDRLVVQPAKEK